MNHYLQRLERLDHRRTLALPVRARLVLLTGQSSFSSSRLTAAQVSFLRDTCIDDAVPLPLGFPYHPDFDCDEPDPSLVQASLRNSLQYFWSLYSTRYQHAVARALQPLFLNTCESLFILTGSCGLQLLTQAWPLLETPTHLDVRVVALGPVARVSAQPAVLSLRGTRDFWSRFLYRGAITAHCETGHLDYWNSAQARQMVKSLFEKRCV